MDTVALKVNKIFKVTGKYAHVSISNDAFACIKGVRPLMAYTTGKNQDGHGVRIFDFNGTKVFTCFNKAGEGEQYGKAKILMLESDARALGGKDVAVIEQERANEVPLEFSDDAFAVQA